MKKDTRYFTKKVQIYRGYKRGLAIYGFVCLFLVPFLLYFMVAVSAQAMSVFNDAGNALLIAKVK